MCFALDVAMSGRWHRFFVFLCLVTIFLDYSTSKDRGLCGRGMCVPFIWLGGVSMWLDVCFSAGVVVMVAQGGALGRGVLG
jgi:hypothetical protein